MRLHAAARIARRLMPAGLFSALRGLGKAMAGPMIFSYETGHFRTALGSKAVDRHGAPQPWYTLPATDFLRYQDLSGTRVLEWGAGQSTLWWGARARTVESFESDPRWYSRLLPMIGPNVTLHLTSNDLAGVDSVLRGPYDLVVIDGLDRFCCAKLSVNVLAPDGGILFDNSDAYAAADGTYPVIELMRSMGFARIDFYGFAPGEIVPHCTSLFFRDTCFLLRNPSPPARSRLSPNQG